MRQMLLDPEQGYGKQLLHLLVDEIRVDTQSATLRGSTAALENAVSEMKMGAPVGVPRFVSDWRPCMPLRRLSGLSTIVLTKNIWGNFRGILKRID